MVRFQGNYNVIVVDWKNGAREVNYYQAAANIRVVGAQVSQLLEIFKRVYNIDPASVHVIGHSLGAHAAGYAGEYLEGIGRITGKCPSISIAPFELFLKIKKLVN